MSKRSLGIDVLTAAQQRIAWTFDHFAKIYLSFSGGKDSTAMLHLVMAEAIKRNRKIGVLFIDLEGQYKLTIDHVQKCFDLYQDNIEPYWCCLPMELRNAVSVFQTQWLCWEDAKRDAWIRELPPTGIHDSSYFPFFGEGMDFGDFCYEFHRWYGVSEPCACFVGIRSNESLNRYRTIASLHKTRMDGKQWTTEVRPDCWNVYPLYDWRTEDVWTYQGKNVQLPYNRLYDLMWKAGLSIHQQRICQPYGDDQKRGLWLFHLIEPETWGRIVARVNGANAGAMYAQQSGNITGYRRISKPPEHTWKSFAALLLNSMPPKTKEHYQNKIAVFLHWWAENGYLEILDEGPYDLEAKREVPSWRRICKALLRNDYWCRSMSFAPNNSGEGYQKYRELMRRRKEGTWEPGLFSWADS